MTRFDLAGIADAVVAGLRAESERLDDEQAVYGIDAREELELQPTLAEAMCAAGYGVFREQRYPADRRRHPRNESEGERCDFVLTPDERGLRQANGEPSLFDDPEAVDLDVALWVEAKVVHQFQIDGANAGYSSQLLSTVRHDVTKLSKDDGILHAALLIVLFVRDGAVVEHDLNVWQSRCLERGLPIGAPYRRRLEITDRIGNGVCAVELVPVHHL